MMYSLRYLRYLGDFHCITLRWLVTSIYKGLRGFFYAGYKTWTLRLFDRYFTTKSFNRINWSDARKGQSLPAKPPSGPRGIGSGAIDSDTSRSRDLSLSDSGGDLREDFSSSIMSSMGTYVQKRFTINLIVFKCLLVLTSGGRTGFSGAINSTSFVDNWCHMVDASQYAHSATCWRKECISDSSFLQMRRLLTFSAHTWLLRPTRAAVTMHLMRRETFSQTLVWMPMCCSTSCSSICLSRMSSMSMQQVRLCSASVENSVCRLVGASSSDMADVLPESSSTTGAVGEKTRVIQQLSSFRVRIHTNGTASRWIGHFRFALLARRLRYFGQLLLALRILLLFTH